MKKLQPCFCLGVFLFVAIQTSIATAAPERTIEDYYGRWEMTIIDPNSSFNACFLKLGEKEGKPTGELVWKWGSVWHFEIARAVEVNDEGKLVIKRRNPLVLNRIGNVLLGYEESKNRKLPVHARLGDDGVDVTGVWNVLVTLPDGDVRGTLILLDDGANGISARAFDGDGDEVEISAVSVTGEQLTVSFMSNEGDALKLQADVRGDRLSGNLHADYETFPMRADRRRRGGKPVKLLAESGTAGWHARPQVNKPFQWSCENGVLSNVSGTVDIVSDLQFQDFKLDLEYNITKGGNSGVYVRGRYEVQILDDQGRGVQKHGNGAVYSRLVPKKNISKPHGEWQKFEITLVDRYLTVVLNSETLIDNQRLEGITGGALDSYESMPGSLMLQGDHGKVSFRNIIVTPLVKDLALD